MRGFLGKLHKDDPLVHHHMDDEGLQYSYPFVQCKIIEGDAYIVGINMGCEIVRTLFETLEILTLGTETYRIIDRSVQFNGDGFKELNQCLKYTFLTPWLALNEKNYNKYQRYGSLAARKKMLERILIGNILSMSKGLGYTVSLPINARILKLKEVNTSLKGNPMLGFLGEFEVNFDIPDYLGIGKSVSRGFGTVKKIKE